MNTRVLAKKVASNFRNAYDFSSVQCNLPQDISTEIFQWGKDNIPDSILSEDGRQAPDDIHVTVKYGFHIHDFTKVRDYLMTQKPFKATLGPISLFESPDQDVIKIDIHSPELSKLNDLFSNNFEVTDTHPSYIPHVTIGYVQKGAGAPYAGRKDFEGRKVLLDSALFSGKDNRRTLMKFSLS